MRKKTQKFINMYILYMGDTEGKTSNSLKRWLRIRAKISSSAKSNKEKSSVGGQVMGRPGKAG